MLAQCTFAVYLLKESRVREPLTRCYQFDFTDSSCLLLQEGDQLKFPIRACDQEQFIDACLYAARALSLPSTECFTFASRKCCSFLQNDVSTSGLSNSTNLLMSNHSFKPEAKSCVFCASENAHRRPIELVFGWTEAPQQTEKLINYLNGRSAINATNGEGFGATFPIGVTRRKTRFMIGHDGVVVSAAAATGEKIITPAKAREFGTSWIRAKREILLIFSIFAAHSKNDLKLI